MIKVFLSFTLSLLMIFSFGCKKDSTPVPAPTPIDTLQLLMDSISDDYFVFGYVENSHLGYPTVYDTIGFDTISISQAGIDSVAILSYILHLNDNQSLDSSVLWFVDYSFFPPYSEDSKFYLFDDSIDFRISNHPGIAGGTDTIYRGIKLN